MNDNNAKMLTICKRLAAVELGLASQKLLLCLGGKPLDVETALTMFRHIARQATVVLGREVGSSSPSAPIANTAARPIDETCDCKPVSNVSLSDPLRS